MGGKGWDHNAHIHTHTYVKLWMFNEYELDFHPYYCSGYKPSIL